MFKSNKKHFRQQSATRRYIAFLIVFILFSGIQVFAQQGISSPYTRYGFGKIVQPGFGQNFALGGTGFALPGDDKLNNLNPASLTAMRLNSVIYEFGTSFNYTNISNGEESLYRTDAALAYGAIGFPITKWWAVSVGFKPYTTVNYSIRNEDQINDSTRLLSYYEGQGGLTQLYFSNSFQFHKSFSVGVTSSYLFGPIEYINRAAFSQEDYVSSTKIVNRSFFRDFYFGYGFQFNRKIGERTKLYVGGIFENQQSINLTSTREFTNRKSYIHTESVLTDTIANDTINKGKALFPQNMGAGVALIIDSLFASSDRLILSADYYTSNWAKAKLFDEESTVLSNSYRVSAGIEYTPSIIGKNYYKVIRYRAGFRYGESYIRLSPDTPLQEYALSFGVALPLKGNPSMINIGIEAGKFGTTENNQLQETFVNFNLNLSLFDLWFVKRKFD